MTKFDVTEEAAAPTYNQESLELNFLESMHKRERAGKDAAEPDMIVSPPHYTQGGVEVIDIIRDAVKGVEPFEAVALANCIKYLLRYKHKNGSQDLNKCRQYLDWLIEDVERQEAEAAADGK